VINPKYYPIITQEECESPREHTIDLKDDLTPVVANAERNFVLVIANSSKVDTYVTNDSNMITKDPPYPQILVEAGTTSQPESDFLRELKNVHIWIPLLQAIKDVPIYAKTIKDLYIKNQLRTPLLIM